jgi:hypothetical protein
MKRRATIAFTILSLLVLTFCAPAARAESNEASEAFKKGLDAVAAQQWADALGWFERANAITPHALAMYNVGVAEMRLGHLTRARVAFHQSLAFDAEKNHTQLAPSLADEMTGFIRDIETRLVYVTITIDPPGSTVTVDGKPLALDPTGRTKLYIAGISAAADQPPELPTTFEAAVDPGQRDIVIQKPGFAPQVSRETYPTGQRVDLHLSLNALDATLHVESSRAGAVVRIQGLDVGVVPVTVKRPPGTYSLDVRSPGYTTYSSTVTLGPGGRSDIQAPMSKEQLVLTRQWWFWAGVGAVVLGSAITVYAVTRPAPPYEGGSSGWVAQTH